MRYFQGPARIERLRRRLVVTGQLIDVTEEARQQGLSYAVYLSRRLWTALVRPYPFAEPGDCLSVATLLGHLQRRLAIANAASPSLLLVLPPHVPEWFHAPCYLRIAVNCPPNGQASVLIQPQEDALPLRVHPEEDSLPASLLLRLAMTLSTLSLVGRYIEWPFIQTMQTAALSLAGQGPFYAEILRHLEHTPPEASTHLSTESHRAMLLVQLDEILASLAPCASRHAALYLDLLRRRYRVLVSPLAELANLTESLLRLAGQVPSQQGPIRYEPFRPLLSVYVGLNARLDRLETRIPRDALSAIEMHTSLLAKVLPTDLQNAFRRIEDELDRLSEYPSGLNDVRLPYCKHHSVIWH
jgi:hypothetical protein